MSYYVLTTKQELPEEYRTGLTVEDKQGIASRLVEVAFMTKENYEENSVRLAVLNRVGAIRLVEDWVYTSYIVFETQVDANNYISVIDEVSLIGQGLRGSVLEPVVPRTLTEMDESEWEWFRSLNQDKAVIPTRQFTS